MSNLLTQNASKFLVFLFENDLRYNLTFNEHFHLYFEQMNRYKNIEHIQLDASLSDDSNKLEALKRSQENLLDKCRLFIKNKNIN